MRDQLGPIVSAAGSGKQIFVGTQRERAGCVFVSPVEYERRRSSFRHRAGEIEVERLRRHWRSEREQVENVGKPLRVSIRGEAVAYLVPTPRALATKIARTEAAFTKATELPSAEELSEFRRLLALGREIVKEWRELRGLKRDVPPPPPPRGS